MMPSCGDPDPSACGTGQICEPLPVCGDGLAVVMEACDGTDLRGESCATRGFDGGELACSSDCGGFDESACARCGDGVCATGEETSTCAQDCFVAKLAFTAESIGDDVGLELFVVDDAGSHLVKLSGTLPSGARVYGFDWSPDRRWIAFVVDHANGLYELYVVPSRGGSPVRIAGEGFHAEFAWAPDGSRIAFLSDQEVNGVRELYTVLPDGGGTVRISGPLLLGDNVGTFAWSPDSSRIAYQASGTFASTLATDAPVGGDRAAIHGALFPARVLVSWAWAPDGSRIAYIADRDTEGVRELYTSLPGGSGTVKVSGALATGGDVGEFKWAPDSTRLAYTADQDTDGVVALYTSIASGGTNVRVSGAATANVFNVQWAPDASRLAFGIGSTLFTGLATGGSVPIADTASDNVEWAPDGARIAFLDYGSGSSELRTSLPAGGGSVLIADEVTAFRWRPDGARIAFDRGNDFVSALPVGGDEIALGMVGDNADTLDFTWAPDGSHVAYLVADYASSVHELHVSASSGNDEVIVSGTMTLNAILASYAWAPE
ncbi:MAG: TolB family protein [Kofleriaceae bacterium]